MGPRQHSAPRPHLALTSPMRRTTRFRQLLSVPEILVMPCCHDGLSARVLEQAGFEAIAAAGFGLSGSL
ncbi:MAG: isocitrate lyase/phosphoenolpyruvate mutase family protein, partial [Cyanobium sp.]